MIGLIKQHSNMIVHHKVSTLFKFDTLTPNYMLTRPKKETEMVPNPLSAMEQACHPMSTPKHDRMD